VRASTDNAKKHPAQKSKRFRSWLEKLKPEKPAHKEEGRRIDGGHLDITQPLQEHKKPEEAPRHSAGKHKTVLLFVKILMMIFFCEAAIKALLLEPGLQNVWSGVLDATLLTALIAPPLYWLIIKLLQNLLQQHKQREKELRESEERVSQIVQECSIPIFVVNNEHIVTYWNKACENLTGIPANKVIGTQKQWLPFYAAKRPVMADLVTDSLPEEEIRRYYGDKYRKCAFLEGAFEAEDFYPDLGQKGKWLFFTAAPLKNADGKVVGAIETFQDITERKHAEKALREERNMAQKYLDIAGVIFVAINTRGEVTLINKRGCEILGYDEAEIVGKNWFDNFLPKRLREEVKAVFKELIVGKTESVEYFKNPVRTKNGSERIIAWHNTILCDESGNIAGTLAFGEDITECKQAEKQIWQARVQLEHTSRLVTVGEMASGLAHELNQPLCAIQNYAGGCRQMIRRKAANSTKLTDAVDQIARQAERAGDIIRRIKTLVSKCEPKRSAVSINDIVREVVSLEKSEAYQKNIIVETKLAENMPLILADKVEIEQVLLNLVRNGFEAMSGTVIDRRQLTIQTSMIGDDAIEVAVRDTGKGLSKEDVEKIFDFFFTTKPTGLGIGLSLSRTIIEAHGGSIWAEPNPDCGTIFRFTLPLKGAEYGQIRADSICRR